MKFLNIALKALAVLSATALPASADQVTWNVGFVRATGSAYLETLLAVPARISAVTNGRLKIELFDTLVPGTDQPAAVRQGRLDGSFAVNPWLSAEAPIMNFGHLPGLLTDVAEFQTMLDPLLRDEMQKVWAEKYNAVQLGIGVFETQCIISKAPLHQVADFKGKKVRVHNTEAAALMQQLGAAPTAVSFAEIVPALQRDIVDVVMTSVGTASGMGFPTVAKEISLWRIGTVVPWSFVVNKDKWDALPEDLKPIVKAEFRKIEDEHFAGMEAFSKRNIDKLVGQGMNLYVATPDNLAEVFKPANTDPVYEKWYKLNEASGTDGRALVAKIQALKKKI